jgi:hypothetical protein
MPSLCRELIDTPIEFGSRFSLIYGERRNTTADSVDASPQSTLRIFYHKGINCEDTDSA